MTLYNQAYLVIEDGAGTTAEFQFQNGLEDVTDINKRYIMADRGQYIAEVADNDVVDLGIDEIRERRTGFWIDGGAGEWQITLTFQTGLEDVTWGDSSGGTGPSNVTQTDASGKNVKPLDRKHVLEHWIGRTRTDSFGQARLHWGQWTDGTYSSSAGVFGQPMPVAVRSSNLQSVDVDRDTGTMNGTLELSRVALFPSDVIPGWVTNGAEKIQEQLEGLLE